MLGAHDTLSVPPLPLRRNDSTESSRERQEHGEKRGSSDQGEGLHQEVLPQGAIWVSPTDHLGKNAGSVPGLEEHLMGLETLSLRQAVKCKQGHEATPGLALCSVQMKTRPEASRLWTGLGLRSRWPPQPQPPEGPGHPGTAD